MVKKIEEEDLYQIKEAGLTRWRPDSLNSFLWMCILIGCIGTLFSLFGVSESDGMVSRTAADAVRAATIILGIQILLAIFFSFKRLAFSMQKFHLIITAIFYIKASIDLYLLFFTVADHDGAPQYLFYTALVLISGGFLFLIVLIMRSFSLAGQGELRKGGKGLYDLFHMKFIGLPAFLGIVMLAVTIAAVVTDLDLELPFILFLCVFIQYGIKLVLPEIILLIYGKFKFKSFQIPGGNDVARTGRM